MGKMRRLIIFLVLVVFLINSVSAYGIYVRPLNSSGSLTPSTTYSYRFDFCVDSGGSTCPLSKAYSLTTDAYGIAFVDISTSTVTYPVFYLLEYRGNPLTLRKVHTLPDSFNNNIYGSSGNFTNNVSSDWFKGKLNWSYIQNSPSYLLDTDQRYNETNTIVNNNASWLSTYNESYNIGINNESYLSTYNESYNIGINNGSYLSTYNQSYRTLDNGTFTTNISLGDRNLSTSGTGFFGWIGSIVSRITKGWFVDLDVSGVLNATNVLLSGNLSVANITAQNIKASGYLNVTGNWYLGAGSAIYDLNNPSAYYIQPSGTSRFNVIQMAGGLTVPGNLTVTGNITTDVISGNKINFTNGYFTNIFNSSDINTRIVSNDTIIKNNTSPTFKNVTANIYVTKIISGEYYGTCTNSTGYTFIGNLSTGAICN